MSSFGLFCLIVGNANVYQNFRLSHCTDLHHTTMQGKLGIFANLAAISPSSNKTMVLFMWKKGGKGYWLSKQQNYQTFVMMLCGSNELMHVKNEEPQWNVGNIQCFYNKLRMKSRLHMDAFVGMRVNNSPSISISYLDSLGLHQVETAFKICSYLLVFSYLQVPHFIKWWLLAQGSFGQWWLLVSVWRALSICGMSPGKNTGQMNANGPDATKHLDLAKWHFSTSEKALTLKFELRRIKHCTGTRFI